MSIPPLLAEALHIKKQFNIGLLRQLVQLIYLRLSRCRLDPWEYYFFQVYLDRYPMKEKHRFAGWRREVTVDRLVNPGSARELANDKLLFYTTMNARGAPLPKLAAVYCNQDQNIPGAVPLHDPGEIAKFITDPAHMPLFIKPLRGAHGHNNFAIRGPSSNRRDVTLLSGQRVRVKDLVTTLVQHDQGGWLFQELLRTDHAIGKLCGDRLTSLRFIVIVADYGPEILSAVWKIPTGTNVTDNFDVGRNGNLVAGIDPATGNIRRVVQGVGWKNIPVTRHPDTGAKLDDAQLPGWENAKALCLELAPHIPGLRLQHSDIALTNRGPVLLELNVAGGMRAHQIVEQRGIFGERLTALEEQCRSQEKQDRKI